MLFRSIRDGTAALDERSAFRHLIEDGLKAAAHHEGKLTEQIDRHTWITMSLQRSVDAVSNRLQSGLAVLATVGSTAPFVGLFGTVWGIYHALTAIGIAGQAYNRSSPTEWPSVSLTFLKWSRSR